ncbi:uncharacterized protein LOC121867511 [Homarus americanus]|nr:uncharacterized protein LOC121867511 [Homarus americanus]
MTFWRVLAMSLLVALYMEESSSAPSSGGQCLQEGRQDIEGTCGPDVITNGTQSFTTVKRVSHWSYENLTLIIKPGADFNTLNITLSLAKLSATPDDADTLPGHLWQGVKDWLIGDTLEKVRDNVNKVLSSVSSKFNDLTMGSHSQLMSAREMNLTDTCHWYKLTVQTVRNDRNGPDNWAISVWVDGTPHLYTTQYWWHVNWVVGLEVSSRGSSQWITTRDTICPSWPWWWWVVLVAGVVLLMMVVALVLFFFYCRQCCVHLRATPNDEAVPLDGVKQLTLYGLSREVTASTKRWVFFKVIRGQQRGEDET